jgi:hypothetical protein
MVRNHVVSSFVESSSDIEKVSTLENSQLRQVKKTHLVEQWVCKLVLFLHFFCLRLLTFLSWNDPCALCAWPILCFGGGGVVTPWVNYHLHWYHNNETLQFPLLFSCFYLTLKKCPIPRQTQTNASNPKLNNFLGLNPKP